MWLVDPDRMHRLPKVLSEPLQPCSRIGLLEIGAHRILAKQIDHVIDAALDVGVARILYQDSLVRRQIPIRLDARDRTVRQFGRQVGDRAGHVASLEPYLQAEHHSMMDDLIEDRHPCLAQVRGTQSIEGPGDDRAPAGRLEPVQLAHDLVRLEVVVEHPQRHPTVRGTWIGKLGLFHLTLHVGRSLS